MGEQWMRLPDGTPEKPEIAKLLLQHLLQAGLQEQWKDRPWVKALALYTTA